MGKKAAPSYNAGGAIAAQTQANNQASAANARAANQFGPFGSATTQVDASGQPTGQTRALNPTLQGAADAVQGGVAQSSGWLPNQRFSLSDVPSAERLGKEAYEQSMAYARGDLDRRRKEADEQLYNRGLRPGGEAYEAGMSPVLDAESRFIADASARATQAGYDQRQREIGNILAERNQGYQDAGQGISLLSGMGNLMPQAPQLQQQTPVNAMGAYQNQYQADMNRYKEDQASRNALMQAGVSLAAAPFSGGTSLIGLGLTAAGNMFNSPGWRSPDTGMAYNTRTGLYNG